MLCGTPRLSSRHTTVHLYHQIRQFSAANTLVLKYSPDFAISEARRDSPYKFVLHARLFATKALNSLFFIIYVHTAMKSTPTLCKLLIFIICMCILLFCFKSFFLSVLLSYFSAEPALFVRHIPLARGPLRALCSILGKSGVRRILFFH